MSSLGRIEVTVIGPAGDVVSGASVQIQRQGAQVSGSSSGNTITVDSPNAVVAGDTVALNTTTTPTRSVSSVTATTVVVGGPGFSSWSDDDRVSIVSALPTIWEDPEGNTTKANPLTTSSTGLAWCYATGGRYDVVITNGATVTMIQDFEAVGGESRVCNIYPSGSSTVYQYDTLRALAAGDTHTALKAAGSTVFSVAGDGEITAGIAGATHSLTGTLTTSQGITATTGNLTLTAGSLSQAGVTGGISQTGGLGANTLTQPTTCSGNLTVSGSGKSLTVTATTGIVNSGGKTRTTGGPVQIATMAAFADADATPSISGGNFFQVANTGATNVTNFDDGPNSNSYTQVIHLLFTNANTTIVHDVTKIKNRSGANITPGANTTRTYISDASTPTIWYELS